MHIRAGDGGKGGGGGGGGKKCYFFEKFCVLTEGMIP